MDASSSASPGPVVSTTHQCEKKIADLPLRSKPSSVFSSTTITSTTSTFVETTCIHQLSLHSSSTTSLSTRTHSACLPASPSPFSMPLASLAGELQHALPPAAVSPEDVALLAEGHLPKKQQEQPAAATTEKPAATEAGAKVSTTRRAAPCDVAPLDTADDASPPCSTRPGSGGVSEPMPPGSFSNKGRLTSTATSLASIAAASASQGALQPVAPPHGVKAVCGKRAKMEDAFSVQCNFADVNLTATLDYANKLPARIASQVGEQLEVPSQSQPAGSGSPPASAPLSPSSAFATSSLLAQTMGAADVAGSVGGSATCTTYSSSHSGVDAFDGSSTSSASGSASGSGSGAACSDTLHFFAVYDGHGGVEAAQHCANRMHHHLSAALALVAGATVHTQDAFCLANRTHGPDGMPTTTAIQCQAEWTLCPTTHTAATATQQPPEGLAQPELLPAHPERSHDTILGPPPGLAALRDVLINCNPIIPGSPASEPEEAVAPAAATRQPQPQQRQLKSQAQHNVDRLFSSSDDAEAVTGAHPLPPPSPVPGEAASAVTVAEAVANAAGEGAGSGSEGDEASNHSGGNAEGSGDGSAARSESAGARSDKSVCCMSEALEQALRSAFLRTDEEFAEDQSSAMVGSTAVVALVGSKKIWIANCGDSRAVLCRGGRAIQVTDDHKPEREDEAERVEKAGGQVLYWNGHRVMGVLAMSRAIGDRGLRPYVIPEPEITVLSRVGEDDFLLLASDGLWDVMSNQEAITLAMRCLQRSYDKGTSRKAAVRVAATVLTRAAVDRGSKDNVTVLIVDLKAPHISLGSGSGNTCAGAGGDCSVTASCAEGLPGCGTADLAAACCAAEEGVEGAEGGGVASALGRSPGAALPSPSLPVGRKGAGVPGGSPPPHRLSRSGGVASAVEGGGEVPGEQGLSFQDTVVGAPGGALEAAAALARRALMTAHGETLAG